MCSQSNALTKLFMPHSLFGGGDPKKPKAAAPVPIAPAEPLTTASSLDPQALERAGIRADEVKRKNFRNSLRIELSPSASKPGLNY